MAETLPERFVAVVPTIGFSLATMQHLRTSTPQHPGTDSPGTARRHRAIAGLVLVGGLVAAPISPLAGSVLAHGVEPITECVIVNGDGSFTAFFGYNNHENEPADIAHGGDNRLSGAPNSSPTYFPPGRHVAAFSATTRSPRIVWTLLGRDAVAAADSEPCSTNPSVPEAPISLMLMLAPAFVTGWWLRRRQRAGAIAAHSLSN